MASHPSQQYRSGRPAGHDGHSDSRFDEQGGTRLAGSIGSGSHHHHHHRRVHLVIYPGEGYRTVLLTRQGKLVDLANTSYKTTYGHIYVMGGRNERYEMVGGPPPGQGYKDSGGHRAGHTPSGLFTLGPQEHHTTLRWPASAIPYGAKLRAGSDGLIEYFEHGKWKSANGPHGSWTKATIDFKKRDGEPGVITEADLAGFHDLAYHKNGELRAEWIWNDFGEWSWNLMRTGKRTAYYVHTTPEDEAFKRLPLDQDAYLTLIGQSHGCVHLLPRDRDEMMQRGYLKAGIHVLIMPYSSNGPPRGWHGNSLLFRG
ncbi:MAG: L,D-transpeptidase family protein [Candidatus Acidiferrum sp.]